MDSNTKTILIVEDDFLVAQETKRLIKSIGYEVAGVSPNGEKAVEDTCKLKPDIVLMDIKMPKLNGIEAAKLIQEKCPTPVVILTAHESADLVDEAAVSGVGAYLTKPPKAEEIERAVSIALARHTDLMNSRKYIMELKQKEKELNDLNATKDKFMSIIAHDLRGPIGALMAFSEQINIDFDSIEKKDLKKYLLNFHTTSKSVFDLLENLLFWSRVQSGKIKPNYEQFNIIELIDSIINLLSTGANNKKITIVKRINHESIVYSDKNMLHTVIRNLISNAIKYTPENGEITISAGEHGKFCKLTITDTGIGMAEEDVNRLFQIDNTFSYKGTDGEEGTGLGLVLCHELIQKLHGKIGVKSELGKGSSFYFELPCDTVSIND